MLLLFLIFAKFAARGINDADCGILSRMGSDFLTSKLMNSIDLDGVCPYVFAERVDMQDSGVWRKQGIGFRRGNRYLVECASGTGKSSLCSYLIGLRNDYLGKITFDGDDISCLSTRQWTEIRRKHVSLMFQELRLFPELTAYENVEMRGIFSRSVSKVLIEDWFNRLGLVGMMDSRLGLMSFGQQQRVALMRTLAGPFDFLLLDEPTSHLDDANSDAMARLVEEVATENNAGVIVTSIGRHMNMDYDETYAL